MQPKRIYLLIGPKGSGKSYIGDLLDQHFGIPFIRVEDWAREIPKPDGGYTEEYLSEVFSTIENGIRVELEKHNQVCFESTGLSSHFDAMYNSLKQSFKVITIGIKASDTLCLQRIQARDSSIHIPVSETDIQKINTLVRERAIPTDHTLVNEDTSERELIQELDLILNRS
ncbi:ATP-binding protein [Poritiphilus flavus]|uniref:Shikimate kinase n=1 Tax=Poritiphilus flavus TaxID=2697053 RepID=A0A6L9EG87_9FLAO|nr:ATP-binding protein [Poritiphilus flavus]NAS13673.1 hypothetical protein [Poritiphilus flavus]